MNISDSISRGNTLSLGNNLNIGDSLTGVPGSPTSDALKLETNDFYLLEDGSFILLE